MKILSITYTEHYFPTDSDEVIGTLILSYEDDKITKSKYVQFGLDAKRNAPKALFCTGLKTLAEEL